MKNLKIAIVGFLFVYLAFFSGHKNELPAGLFPDNFSVTPDFAAADSIIINSDIYKTPLPFMDGSIVLK